MAERNTAREIAYSVLRQYRQVYLSLDDLVRIAKELGYAVLDFSKSLKEGSTEILIRELGLESFARNGKSFIYKNNDIKIVFLCDTMNAKEKRYALAHELGHEYCGHLKNGACCNEANMEEEHEANEFAHYLLHPDWFGRAATYICKHKVMAIVAFVILLCGIISIPVIKHIQLSKSYYGEYYVTESGEKYHIEDCPVIKDKTNTHRLTIEEFESGKYEPCHICMPEETD